MHRNKKLLAVGLLSALSAMPAIADEDDTDFHFRPFWVEPADRVDFGHGHLVAGVDHDRRPEPGMKRRTALPLEATLGLAWGFSTVLALEGGAHGVFDNNTSTASASREVKLRYSLPEWQGIHFLMFTGFDRPTGGNKRTVSNGYSVAFDTLKGTVGLGQSWDRRHAGEARAGRESAINYFQAGLGSDSKWAAGGELRAVRTAEDTRQSLWLIGIGRIVGKGLMADLAIGGDFERAAGKRVTAGISYYY